MTEYRAKIEEINARHPVKWWVLLFVLLGALVLVGQVNAWYFVDRDGVYGNQLAGGTIVQKLDAQHIMYTYSGFNTIYYDTSYPTTEWSAYIATMSDDGGLNYYPMDSGKSIIVSPVGIETSEDVYYLFKIIRRYTGGIYYYDRYVNGALQNSKSAVGTTPYYCAFGLPYDSKSPTELYFLTGGEDEEENLVITHPSTYFIAKDFTNPAFSGLYSALDSSVWADRFYARYISDTSAKNITIKNKATGVTVYSHATTGVCGLYQFNITEIFFNSGVPYGIYTVALDGSTQSQDIPYMGIVTSGTSVAWGATEYGEDDTATMTFSIAEGYWDTESYTYRLEVWDESLNEVEGWAVTSRPVAATKTTTIDSDYAEGTYYCVLTATDISSGEEVLMAYDTCTVDIPGSGDVWVVGTTYDATTNLTLVSCTVTGTQLGVTQSTTSDAGTGVYEIKTGLVTDWSLGMNASKTGYIGYLMAFTPYEAGTYGVDIPLVPSGGPAPDGYSNATTSYYNSTTDGTALGGICYDGPYWTLSEGATCTVSNATWNTSCTTGAGGWYQCNNIGCGGTYTLTCSKSGYTDYTTSCSLEEGCFNREDCTLESSTDLNVECRELTSGGIITGTQCTVSLSTGETCETTNGTAVFSGLAYGYYEIEATAEGYYPGSTSAVMDEGKTVSCYMQEETEGGSGISYAPKTVRFTVQNIWGKKITECDVECQGYETTAGSWAWLYSLFGINANETPIATAHMEGQTDYKGDINFLMLEPVKYNCTFYKTGEIDKTLDFYPKDDYYLVLSDTYGNTTWYDGGVDINSAINITVATAEVNATHAWINLTYLDTTNLTTGGTCYLNQTNTTVGGPPITLSTCALSAGCSSGCNCTFLVENYAGEGYTLQVDPTHPTWDFERTFTVVFPEEAVNPLGLTGTELAIMAAFFVLFAGALFSAISATAAPLVMSFTGWICYALRWLDAVATPAFAGLVLATVMSIAYLIAIGSHKERWT